MKYLILYKRRLNKQLIKPAYPYQQQLNKAWQNIVFQDKYKYYNSSNYWNYEIELDKDSWNTIQAVSVDQDDNVIGYLSARVVRSSNKISNLGIVNFQNTNITFSRDLHKFLTSLFDYYDFHKIEWTVVIGNPAEKMYDRAVSKYGGRIVGTHRESTKLEDGKYYDVKSYEIFKRDYERHTEGERY